LATQPSVGPIAKYDDVYTIFFNSGVLLAAFNTFSSPPTPNVYLLIITAAVSARALLITPSFSGGMHILYIIATNLVPVASQLLLMVAYTMLLIETLAR